jgi:hypothetical protein
MRNLKFLFASQKISLITLIVFLIGILSGFILGKSSIDLYSFKIPLNIWSISSILYLFFHLNLLNLSLNLKIYTKYLWLINISSISILVGHFINRLSFDRIFPTLLVFIFFFLMNFSMTNIHILVNVIVKSIKNSKIYSEECDYTDMLADLEFTGDPELEKKLKRDWLPGLIWLVISDPVAAAKTATQRFRTR